MKKALRLFIIITFFAMFQACSEEINDPIEYDPFQFMAIADTHCQYPDGSNSLRLQSLINKINSGYFPNTKFMIISGDLVRSLTTDNLEDYTDANDNPATNYKLMMQELAIPYYPALGNHDYYNGSPGENINSYDDLMIREQIWKKVLNLDPYYSFDYNGFSFYALNSIRGPHWQDICFDNAPELCIGSFDKEQLDFLENGLSNGNPSILYFHHPMQGDHPSVVWAAPQLDFMVSLDQTRFYQILEDHQDQVKAIFTGHGHLWARDLLYDKIELYETSAYGDDMANEDNYHLINCNPENGEIEVIKGSSASYIEYPGIEF